jgi:hypothetical protein
MTQGNPQDPLEIVDAAKSAAPSNRPRAQRAGIAEPRLVTAMMDPFRLLLGGRDRDETVGAPVPGQPRADFLRDEIRRLRRRRARFARLSRIYLALGAVFLLGSIVLYWATGRKEAWVGALYSLPLLLTPLLSSSRGLDTDILALESELDLAEATAINAEQRAEKLFKNHQFELQKYYDQTLRHSKWIFVVGVICIFLGFATIAVTFLLVVKPLATVTLQEKLLVAALGVVGSVLANFIAVIYLRMFSEILKSVTDFHNRLVSTHNLYFANFMSTKVGEVARDGIVSEIARNLIGKAGP